MADIPGLLEGAHEGVGMGLAFLRHVARCRVLLHVINGDSKDPVGDFEAINQELKLFNPLLAEKPQVVVLNKCDIPEVAEKAAEIEAKIKAIAGHTRVITISAATSHNVKQLMRNTAKLVGAQPTPPTFAESEPNIERVDLGSGDDDEDANLPLAGKRGLRFDIETHPDFPGQFRVISKRLERLVAMTNWDYYEATQRFDRVLDATGVLEALGKAGAKDGDLIMVHELDFEYAASDSAHMRDVPEYLLKRERAEGVNGEYDEMDDFDFENEGFRLDELFDPAEFDPNEESLQTWDESELPPTVTTTPAAAAVAVAAPSQNPHTVSKKGKALPMGVQVYEINEDDLYGDDDFYD